MIAFFRNCFALWLLTSTSLLAAEYFVATTGLDTDPGTFDKPFATLQRAQTAAKAGDTVQIRGGRYVVTEAQIARKERIWAYVHFFDKSGEPERRITYQAYKDELPVFDFSNAKPENVRITAFYVSGSWLHFKGLEVVGVQVTMTGHTQSICFDSEGSHNIFERLSMHDGQAIGIYAVRGSHNLFLNCDAYNNHDFTSEDKKGGNVDGFGCHPSKGSVGNVFRGCRAWFNSDDGFDCITSCESVTFENCWAFNNGYSPKLEKLADGNGFKMGGYGAMKPERLPDPIPRHTIRFCVAAGNKSSGFYANHHPGGSDWLNNSAYRNGTNFNMLCRTADNSVDVDGYGHTLKNNLAYNARAHISKFDPAKCVVANNSFSMDLKLSDTDFASVDESELMRPRQEDGGLPAIDFLHPAPFSILIDKGLDVGVPFKGAAPDLGAFEK